MNRLDTARRYSLFLARNLDSGKLKPEIFLPMLDKVLTEADFQAFADWDKIRTEENEEELARQLRELRRYVVSQIIVRDINRISDLNEVTRTITLFADFAVNTALDFAYAYYQDMY
ncbi:MAG: bifunctional glutamine synthetase adenylyltransferase/deadenyltransferase, partial [Neisseria sp.]|nr:bifunctional glutamine synthetase adenylyltransferase/deadenyltransferase [Neisseria sp.]